jgi:Holliday junction DNA helicase RuvB
MTLRPKKFNEFQGKTNAETIERLRIAVAAAKKRGEHLGHVLLFGSPGTGKTSIGYIIANEINSSLKVITGGTIETYKDLYLMLCDIIEKQIQKLNVTLFIDEIHLLAKGRIPEEVYYPLLEDFKFYHNLSGTRIKIEDRVYEVKKNLISLEPFTIIGATTAPGNLSKPLRDRFRIQCFLKEYTLEDIKLIISQHAQAQKIAIQEEAMLELAKRARGNPRVALNLLLGVYDLTTSKNEIEITKEAVLQEMILEHIDEEGLTETDLKILYALATHPKGLGLANLSGYCGIEKSTIENMHEQFLKSRGYMDVTHKRFIANSGLELLKRKGLVKV